MDEPEFEEKNDEVLIHSTLEQDKSASVDEYGDLGEGIVVDEDDEDKLYELTQWFSKETDILQSVGKRYAKLLIADEVGSVQRLVKHLRQEGKSYLNKLGFKPFDIEEIIAALKKNGLYNEDLAEHLPGYHEDVTPAATPEPSSIEPVHNEHHPAVSRYHIDTALTAPDADPLSMSTHGGHGLHAPTPRGGATPHPKRAGAGHHFRRNSALVFRQPPSDITKEAETNLEQLKTAVDGKMEIAIVGMLVSIAQSLVGSSDRQRAYFVAEAASMITFVFNEVGDKQPICEKCLVVVSLLCRHSDDSKTSICLENVKALGEKGVIEAISTALSKHPTDAKIMEASCDALRCLSAMEMNRTLIGNANLCEAIGRALGMAKFMQTVETCSWICRAIGHMCVNNDANREKFGSVGACESVVAVLQHHMANANVCTEACWAMRHLAVTLDNRNRFADELGPESVLSVMKSFKSNDILMTEACKALISCIGPEEDEEIIDRIGSSGAISYVLKSVKRNPTNENLARWAFNLLYLISTDLKFWPSLAQNDILDVLSSTLQEHASNEGVAEWGCRTVHEVASVEGIHTKLRNAGLCEMVVSCVQRQAMSAAVSGHGCLAIGDLATDKANHSRLSQSGACEAVVGALKRHDYDANVVFQTCHAIHFLTTTENNVSWMGANGGCEAITKALIKHTTSSLPACRYALKALGSLGLHDEGNLMRFHHAGACAAVVNALRTHLNDELVAEQACRAIYYLCTEPPNVNELGKAGANKLVVQVLKTLSHNPDVVTKSCLAIYGLAVKTKVDKVHAGNTKKLVSMGAIESVVAAVSKSRDDPELVRAGCMAIASLARQDENRVRLGDVGAVQVILNGFSTHGSDERVFCQLAFATDAMSHNNEVNKTKFAEADIIETLLAGLARHERNKFVVGETLRALITLSTHEACKHKVRAENAIKLCVRAFRTHEKEVKVAKWGCNWVHAMATDDIVRERLGQAKASEVVISVLAKHSVASVDVLLWGCKSLIGLSVLDSNLWKFCNTETCTAIVTGLRAHHDDVNGAEWACCALVKLAHNEQNKTRIGGSGGCSALSMTLHKLSPVSLPVVRLACEAIYYLAQDEANRQLFGASGLCEVLSTCLSLHLLKADVVDRICKAIAAVAKQGVSVQNENSARLGASGVCESLTAMVRSHSFAPVVAEWGCAAVAALAVQNPRNQVTFCFPREQSGGISPLLVDVLRSHSNNVVIAQAARAVRALCATNMEVKDKFAFHGVVPVALRALKVHKDDELIIEHVAWILANVVAPTEEPPVPSTSEDPNAVSDSPSRGKYYCPNCKELYKITVYWDLLHSILMSHYASPPLARWLCAAISTFAEQSKVSHAPICDAVMTAVSRHSDNPGVVKYSLSAVGYLALSHQDNCIRLTRASACEITNQILSTYSEGEDICIGAYQAINGLAFQNTINQQRFCNMPKLCVTVAQSLFNELESDIVSIRGCDAIAALAFRHAGNQQKLSSCCSFIADILSTHKSNAFVMSSCCKAISVLSHAHTSNRNKLGALESCEYVPQVMILYMRHPVVTTWAVRAIADLAANNPNNQSRLGSSGACEALVAAIKMITTEDVAHADRVTPVNVPTNSIFGMSFLSTSPLPFAGFSSNNASSANASSSSVAETSAAAGAGAGAGVAQSNTSVASSSKIQCPFTPQECEDLAKWLLWAVANMIQLGRGEAMMVDEGAARKGGVLRQSQPIKNSSRFATVGAAEAVLALLQKYENNAVVAQWGARAVNNFGKSRTLTLTLLEQNAVGMMNVLLDKHAGNSSAEYWIKTAKDTLQQRKESMKEQNQQH